PRKPKRHPGCRDPYDRQFDPRDFLQNGRLNFCVWMFRIGKFARRLPLQHRVHSQHRHSRSLQSLVKWLDSPIEFVIANDQRVVCRMEMHIVSGSSAAAALASVGNALTNPAWPASFKKSRRVQNLSRCNIALLPYREHLTGVPPVSSMKMLAIQHLDREIVSVTLRHA